MALDAVNPFGIDHPTAENPVRLVLQRVDLGAFGVDEAEAAQARIELDRRDEQAAARLDAIRRELDVDPPEGEGA